MKLRQYQDMLEAVQEVVDVIGERIRAASSPCVEGNQRFANEALGFLLDAHDNLNSAWVAISQCVRERRSESRPADGEPNVSEKPTQPDRRPLL